MKASGPGATPVDVDAHSNKHDPCPLQIFQRLKIRLSLCDVCLWDEIPTEDQMKMNESLWLVLFQIIF